MNRNFVSTSLSLICLSDIVQTRTVKCLIKSMKFRLMCRLSSNSNLTKISEKFLLEDINEYPFISNGHESIAGQDDSQVCVKIIISIFRILEFFKFVLMEFTKILHNE